MNLNWSEPTVMPYYRWDERSALPRMFSIVRTITHWANDEEIQFMMFIAPTCSINCTCYNSVAMHKTYEYVEKKSHFSSMS